MLSKIRKHATYTNVAMTLALMFAMSGGAYAAGKIVITSTKQISPKVLKALKGANGKEGAQGPAGSAGPVGPGGPAGAQGPAGKDGAQGIQGEKGERGEPGSEGSPWTATGKLPSGKSETGTWAYVGSKENEAKGTAAISFTLPLEKAPQVEFVYAEKQGAHCVGSATEPTAPKGYLCVYDGDPEELAPGVPGTVKFLGFTNGESFPPSEGSSKEGALLHLETVEIGKSPIPYALAEGTWIVTAE